MTQAIKKYKLTIGWLYPDLMNTYGDRGNIIVLEKRASWRGISVKVEKIFLDTSASTISSCDLIFMGGAQDQQQEIVMKDLRGDKGKVLAKKIENSTPGLYICGAYQFLGRYYKTADDKTLNGLGIFPLYTENLGLRAQRLIGNVVVRANINGIEQDIIGFENHGGRTYIDYKNMKFATVIKGFGNNGKDQTEGIIYKDSIGTYLHGPILPKNPQLADTLITKALEKKYGEKFSLEPIDSSIEQRARDVATSRIQG